MEIQRKVTDKLCDHIPAQLIILAQLDAAEHGQLPCIDPFIVGIQLLDVLRVAIAHRTDGGDAHANQIAVGMGGITLKIAVQSTFPLGDGQFIIRPCEMIHADVDVTGIGQLAGGHVKNLQFYFRRRQFVHFDAALGLEDLRQVGIVENGQAIRADLDDPVQGGRETFTGLMRQPVDQVDAHRTETFRTGCIQHCQGFFLTLDAIDRFLHLGIEILYPQAHAVEADIPQHGDGFGSGLAGIDLDGIFTLVIIQQVEMLACHFHQLAHLRVADEGRRTTTPVQLLHRAVTIEKFALQGDFAVQALQVLVTLAAILGSYLVAGTIKADRIAEGYVEIQRQGTAAGIGLPGNGGVVFGRKAIVKLHRRGVRSITGTALIVLGYQGVIQYELLFH